jgi:predicted transcriptional regulator
MNTCVLYMRAQQSDRSADSIAVPEELSATESKLVYLFVATADGATVDDLQSSLGLTRLTLFPVLDTLSERGLVEQTDGTYVPSAS